MLKILCIGNSFSQDSTTYLYDLASNEGMDLKVVNLYIGGCSLERHWESVLGNKADYDYQLNGVSVGKMVTVKDTLLEENWDVITLQQCSGFSGLIDTYHPYIIELSKYVKEHALGAKQLIHQTWAYEIDSTHEHFVYYHNNQEEMYESLLECYGAVAKDLSLQIIPFGEVVQALRTLPIFDYKNGGKSLCRDGFHMDYVYGRFALAATWFEYVLKEDITQSTYTTPAIEGVTASADEMYLIRKYIHNIIASKLNP